MRLALDTNRYRDVFNGEPETLQVLEEAELVVLPFIVVGELRAGFSGGHDPLVQLLPNRRLALVRAAGDAGVSTRRGSFGSALAGGSQGSLVRAAQLWSAPSC